MTRVLAAPDSDRFPLSAADVAFAESRGVRVAAFPGHAASAFRTHAPDADAALAWGGAYGREVFDAVPGLRVLARCGAGFDNIDLGAARERGIVVTYCPHVFDRVVAEHTIALLLAAVRGVAAGDAAVRAGAWPSAVELGPLGTLEDRVLGLVGLGRIARQVARLAAAVGMRVIAHDPFAEDEPGVARVRSLDVLLAGSDVVSLHLPLTDATRGLLGEAELALMRPGAILVNTARGALVESDALVRALRSGHLGGAALDVFDPEPIPPGHPILSTPRTLLTPHSSAFSEQALARARRQAISDALAVLDGNAPSFALDLTEVTT